MLVSLVVWCRRNQVQSTVRIPRGKRPGRSLMEASDPRPTSLRLFVTNKDSKMQYLVDTGADLCVYPRSFFIRAAWKISVRAHRGKQQHHRDLWDDHDQPQPRTTPSVYLEVRCRRRVQTDYRSGFSRVLWPISRHLWQSSPGSADIIDHQRAYSNVRHP